eukprot:NODE_2305_length_1453_cov_10.560902_g2189_i0.p1 GENE.NODE_2305_length_1453_cov_10.560902_g2189_i0~~NODE_2305_length_1453_cov_10.560902_g2189_i0.p1  ORF type:complete len:344 (-),score=1.89 NODE_2305_length_1453_cov_10.560902_g2189_i0:118-1149(-)
MWVGVFPTLCLLIVASWCCPWVYFHHGFGRRVRQKNITCQICRNIIISGYLQVVDKVSHEPLAYYHTGHLRCHKCSNEIDLYLYFCATGSTAICLGCYNGQTGYAAAHCVKTDTVLKKEVISSPYILDINTQKDIMPSVTMTFVLSGLLSLAMISAFHGECILVGVTYIVVLLVIMSIFGILVLIYVFLGAVIKSRAIFDIRSDTVTATRCGSRFCPLVSFDVLPPPSSPPARIVSLGSPAATGPTDGVLPHRAHSERQHHLVRGRVLRTWLQVPGRHCQKSAGCPTVGGLDYPVAPNSATYLPHHTGPCRPLIHQTSLTSCLLLICNPGAPKAGRLPLFIWP